MKVNYVFSVKALSDKLDAYGAISGYIRIFRKLNFDPGLGVTSKIQLFIFTVPSPCNRRTIVGIESVQYLPYQSM